MGGVGAAMRKLVLHAIVLRAAADRSKLRVVSELCRSAPSRLDHGGVRRRRAAVSAFGDQFADAPLVDRGLVVLDANAVLREVDLGTGDRRLGAKHVLDVVSAAAAAEIENLELRDRHRRTLAKRRER